jgi:hypothetical protein
MASAYSHACKFAILATGEGRQEENIKPNKVLAESINFAPMPDDAFV